MSGDEQVLIDISYAISPQQFQYLGFSPIYDAFQENIKKLANGEILKNDFFYVIQGYEGVGKHLLLKHMFDELEDEKEITSITVIADQNNIVFEITEELLEKLKVELVKMNKLKNSIFGLSVKALESSVGLLSNIDPTPAGVLSKSIKYGFKGVKFLRKRKKKKVIIKVENSNKFEQKKIELFDLIVKISEKKSIVLFIEQMHWLSDTDTRIIVDFYDMIKNKIPIFIIGTFDSAHVENNAVRELLLPKFYVQEIKSFELGNLEKNDLKAWLVYTFVSSKITDEFVDGLYDLTQGNLSIIIKSLDFLRKSNKIDTQNSDLTDKWKLPEKWYSDLPKDLLTLEYVNLENFMTSLEKEYKDQEYSMHQILNMTVILSKKSKSFTYDQLVALLPSEDSKNIDNYLDLGLYNNIYGFDNYRFSFQSEGTLNLLYNKIGIGLKSHLHMDIAQYFEQIGLDSEEDIKDQLKSFVQAIKHYEGGIQSYSFEESQKSSFGAMKSCILAAIYTFLDGDNKIALNLLAKALNYISINPIDYFEVIDDKLMDLDEKVDIPEFILEEFAPPLTLFLSILMVDIIAENSSEKLDPSDFESSLLYISKNYKNGLLSNLTSLNTLIKDDAIDILDRINSLNLIISMMIQFQEYVIQRENEGFSELQLKIIFKDIYTLMELTIKGFTILGENANKAYYYNLLSVYAYRADEKEIGKKLKQLCADSYLESANDDFDDIIIKARMIRNAGWNYFEILMLEKAVQSFMVSKNVLSNSGLTFDYVIYRIAEYDLRSFQLLLLRYRDNIAEFSDDLIPILNDHILKFWENYIKIHPKTNYHKYLLKKFGSLSNKINSQVLDRLESTPTISLTNENESQRKITIISNEFDYWLADYCVEKLLDEDRSLFVKIIEPEEFREDLIADTIIIFGGPKAQYVGEMVNSIFNDQPNFKYLLWRNESGFGGVWSKIYNEKQFILCAGNDEETIDAAIIFCKLKDKWSRNYHDSTLNNYFIHLSEK